MKFIFIITATSLIFFIMNCTNGRLKKFAEIYKHNPFGNDTCNVLTNDVKKDENGNIFLLEDSLCKNYVLKDYYLIIEHESNLDLKNIMMDIGFTGIVYHGPYKRNIQIKNVRICLDKYDREMRGLEFWLYEKSGGKFYIYTFQILHTFNFLKDSTFYIKLLDKGGYEFKFKEEDSYFTADDF